MFVGFDSIDAFVQHLVFGGDGWYPEKMTWQNEGDVSGSDFTYTLLNVTGKGLLMGMYTVNDVYAIQVDGGPRMKVHFAGPAYTPLMISFNTSVKVTAGTQTGTKGAVILFDHGKKWSDRSFWTTTPTTGSHLATTVVDVSGAGVFIGVQPESNTSYSYVIEVDGVLYNVGTIHGGTDANNLYFGLPFKYRLKVTSSGTGHSALYQLD